MTAPSSRRSRPRTRALRQRADSTPQPRASARRRPQPPNQPSPPPGKSPLLPRRNPRRNSPKHSLRPKQDDKPRRHRRRTQHLDLHRLRSRRPPNPRHRRNRRPRRTHPPQRQRCAAQPPRPANHVLAALGRILLRRKTTSLRPTQRRYRRRSHRRDGRSRRHTPAAARTRSDHRYYRSVLRHNPAVGASP